MKRIVSAVLMLSLCLMGMIGCAEKSSTKTETEIRTPDGKAAITTEQDVKKTGKNPPSAHS